MDFSSVMWVFRSCSLSIENHPSRKQQNNKTYCQKSSAEASVVRTETSLWPGNLLGWTHGSDDRNFTIVIGIVGLLLHLFRGRLTTYTYIGVIGHLVTKYQQDIPVAFQTPAEKIDPF